MLNCIKWIMHVWATVYPYRLHLKISTLLDIMYTYWVSPNFNAVGKKCRIRRGLKLYGNAKCIFIVIVRKKFNISAKRLLPLCQIVL